MGGAACGPPAVLRASQRRAGQGCSLVVPRALMDNWEKRDLLTESPFGEISHWGYWFVARDYFASLYIV